jgi:hypothetical protein
MSESEVLRRNVACALLARVADLDPCTHGYLHMYRLTRLSWLKGDVYFNERIAVSRIREDAVLGAMACAMLMMHLI